MALQVVARLVPIGNVQWFHQRTVCVALAEPPLLGGEKVCTVSRSQLAVLVQEANVLPKDRQVLSGGVYLHQQNNVL